MTIDGRKRHLLTDTLGLPLVEDAPFALVFAAGETMLRVQKVAGLTPQPFTALGWHVDDLAETVAALVRRGVVFQHFEGVQQDEAGIWTTPSGDRIAWFKDPDGNLLSLTEFNRG